MMKMEGNEARFVLQEYFQSPLPSLPEVDPSDLIIHAIKYASHEVKIASCFLSEQIDLSYINELVMLPDYNTCYGYRKAVLVALWTYVRLRLFPLSRRDAGHSMLDITFLEALHSTILKGIVQQSMPRVALQWLRAFATDDVALVSLIVEGPGAAMDIILTGDVESLKRQFALNAAQLHGWAQLQMPTLGGWTLLHYAASLNTMRLMVCQDIIPALLEHDIYVNAVDYACCSPLHVACQHFSLEVIKVLTALPKVNRKAVNREGRIPLQVFVGKLLTVPKGIQIDFRVVFAAIKSLLPFADAAYLLDNCSMHRFKSGLLACLLYPDRELGFAVVNLIVPSISSHNAAEAYPVLLDALIGCIAAKQNTFFNQLFDLIKACQSVYQVNPNVLYWEVFTVMMVSAIHVRNSTAMWWAIDHIAGFLEYDSLNGDCAQLYCISSGRVAWRWCIHTAIMQDEDRVLLALFKKLPVQFIFPLLEQCEVMQTHSDVPTETVLENVEAMASIGCKLSLAQCVKQHFGYLLDQRLVAAMERFPISSLAAVLGHKNCLNAILKHIYLNANHMAMGASVVHKQIMRACALHGHVACLEILRDAIGLEHFAACCFGKDSPTELSVFDQFVISVRQRLVVGHEAYDLRPTASKNAINYAHIGSSSNQVYNCCYQGQVTNETIQSILNLFLKNIHLYNHSNSITIAGSLAAVDHLPHSMQTRAAQLTAFLNTKLSLASLPPGNLPNCVLIKFLINSNDKARRMHTICQQHSKAWRELEGTCSSHAFKTGIRKLVRGGNKFVPSAAWLKLGYLLVTLFDMLNCSTGDERVPEFHSISWGAVEKLLSGFVKSPAAFNSAMEKLLSMRKTFTCSSQSSSSSSSGCIWRKNHWEALDRINEDGTIRAAFTSNPIGLTDSTGIMFNKELHRNNLYHGNNSIEFACVTLSKFVRLVIEEGRLWYQLGDGLLFSNFVSTPVEEALHIHATSAESLLHSDWFQVIKLNLEGVDFINVLAAQNELENLNYHMYFMPGSDSGYNLLTPLLDQKYSGHLSHLFVGTLKQKWHDFHFLSKFHGLVSNATNNMLMLKNNKFAFKLPAQNPLDSDILENVLCSLLEHNHHLYTRVQTGVFHRHGLMKESLLKYLLPLTAMKCYRAADKLLDIYASCGTVVASSVENATSPDALDANAHFVNFNYMACLGHLVAKRKKGYLALLRHYQSSQFADGKWASSAGMVDEVIGTTDLFLLTPLHFACYHHNQNFLSRFMKIFPLFSINLLDFVEFARDLHLDQLALYLMYRTPNICCTFFIPSNVTAERLNFTRSSSGVCQVLETAVECILLSYLHSVVANHSNLSSIVCNISRYLAPYVHSIAHIKSSTISSINLMRDMRVKLMDNSVVFVSDLLNNINNLARSMPTISHHTHFHIIHCVSHVVSRRSIFGDTVHGLQSSQQRTVDLLEDVVLNRQGFAEMNAAHNCFVVDEFGYAPLVQLMKYRFYSLSKHVLQQILPEVNITTVNQKEINNYYNIYEFLVHQHTVKPSTEISYLFDIDGVVLNNHQRLLASMESVSCHSINIWESIRTISHSNFIYTGSNRFLPLDVILNPSNAANIGSAIGSGELKKCVDLTDSMCLLHVVLQYSQYIYSLLTQSQPGKRCSMNENVSYFLQYAVSGAYGKLDVFIRARQALSLLNIPFSTLCSVDFVESGGEKEEKGPEAAVDGGFGVIADSPSNGKVSNNWTALSADAMKLCQSLSRISYSQLKQLVCGFFRLRCAETSKQHRREMSEQGKSTVIASSAMQDGLLAWHSLWLTCVSLGSSGLSLQKYLEKYHNPRIARNGNNSGSSMNNYNVGVGLSGRDENFDLLKVMQFELSSNLQGTPLFGGGGTQRGTEGSDTQGLACALDTAYLILDLARYVCLARSLLLVTQELDETQQQLGERMNSKLVGFERKQHPLYRDQQRYAHVAAEHKRLLSILKAKAQAGVPEASTVPRPLQRLLRGGGDESESIKIGLRQRIAILDGISGDQLRLFLRINPQYSSRLNKLRKVLSQALSALLLDLGHVNHSELVCRVMLQHHNPQKNASAAPPSPSKDSSMGASSSAASFARLSESSHTFNQMVQILQSLHVGDFLQPEQSSIIKERFKRFKKFMIGLTPSFQEGSSREEDASGTNKDWQNTLASLRGGIPLTPMTSELSHLLTLFDSLQHDDPLSSSTKQLARKEQLMAEADNSLCSGLSAASALYWMVTAVFGLLQKADEDDFKEDISTALRRSKELSVVGDFSLHSNPLLALCDAHRMTSSSTWQTDANRVVCSEYLVRLGCQFFQPFSRTISLGAVEISALSGDIQMLRALLRPFFNAGQAIEIKKVAMHKTLIFHVLLSIPTARTSLSAHKLSCVQNDYISCAEVLLSHGFPVFSPVSSCLTCLDIVVLKQAWALLSTVFQRSHSDSIHAALSTDEAIKFSNHLISMVGLSCSLHQHSVLAVSGKEVLSMLFKAISGKSIVNKMIDLKQLLFCPEVDHVLGVHAQLTIEICRMIAPTPTTPAEAISVVKLKEEMVSSLQTICRSAEVALPSSVSKEDHWMHCPVREATKALCNAEGAAASCSVVELAVLSGDPAMLAAVFVKVFPVEDVMRAMENGSDGGSSKLQQLVALLRICCVYGLSDMITALHGLCSSISARDEAKDCVANITDKLWADVLSSCLFQHDLLLVMMRTPSSLKAFQTILEISLQVGLCADDGVWLQAFSVGLCSGHASEPHLCALLMHLLSPQASSSVGEADGGVVLHLSTQRLSHGETLLHVLCKRGYSALAALWMEHVCNDLSILDDSLMTALQVSIGLGHAQVTRVLRPHVPPRIDWAVREIVFYLRCAVLTRSDRPKRAPRRDGRKRRPWKFA